MALTLMNFLGRVVSTLSSLIILVAFVCACFDFIFPAPLGLVLAPLVFYNPVCRTLSPTLSPATETDDYVTEYSSHLSMVTTISRLRKLVVLLLVVLVLSVLYICNIPQAFCQFAPFTDVNHKVLLMLASPEPQSRFGMSSVDKVVTSVGSYVSLIPLPTWVTGSLPQTPPPPLPLMMGIILQKVKGMVQWQFLVDQKTLAFEIMLVGFVLMVALAYWLVSLVLRFVWKVMVIPLRHLCRWCRLPIGNATISEETPVITPVSPRKHSRWLAGIRWLMMLFLLGLLSYILILPPRDKTCVANSDDHEEFTQRFHSPWTKWLLAVLEAVGSFKATKPVNTSSGYVPEVKAILSLSSSDQFTNGELLFVVIVMVVAEYLLLLIVQMIYRLIKWIVLSSMAWLQGWDLLVINDDHERDAILNIEMKTEQRALITVQNELDTYKATVVIFIIMLMNLGNYLDHVNQQVTDVANNNVKLEALVAAKDVDIANLKEEANKNATTILLLQKLMLILEQDKSNLVKQVKDKVKKLDDMKTDVKSKDEELDDLKTDVILKHKELTELRDQLTSKHKDLVALKDQLKSKHKELTDSNNRVSCRDMKIDNLQTQMILKDEELDNLLNQIKDKGDQLEAAENKLADVTTELQESHNTNNQLTSLNTTLEEELLTLTKTYHLQLDRIHELEEQLRIKDERFADLDRSNSDDNADDSLTKAANFNGN